VSRKFFQQGRNRGGADRAQSVPSMVSKRRLPFG
jgi:hypothetical protein